MTGFLRQIIGKDISAGGTTTEGNYLTLNTDTNLVDWTAFGYDQEPFDVDVITTNGTHTYDPADGISSLVIELIGGGGGGASGGVGGDVGWGGSGSGGGLGERALVFISMMSSPISLQAVIGAGGTGGAGTSTVFDNGNSSFDGSSGNPGTQGGAASATITFTNGAVCYAEAEGGSGGDQGWGGSRTDSSATAGGAAPTDALMRSSAGAYGERFVWKATASQTVFSNGSMSHTDRNHVILINGVELSRKLYSRGSVSSFTLATGVSAGTIVESVDRTLLGAPLPIAIPTASAIMLLGARVAPFKVTSNSLYGSAYWATAGSNATYDNTAKGGDGAYFPGVGNAAAVGGAAGYGAHKDGYDGADATVPGSGGGGGGGSMGLYTGGPVTAHMSGAGGDGANGIIRVYKFHR